MRLVDIGHRRSARSRDTRDAIVEAAATVFSEQGYDATSLEHIAGLAGVTKGTIYYHFNSKDAIYTTVLVRYIGEAVERAQAVIAATDDPCEALSRIIDQAIEDSLDATKRYIHFQERVRVSEEMGAAIREMQRQYHGLVVQVLQAGQARGVIVEGDPQALARILNGTLGRPAIWYQPQGRVKPQEFAAMLKGFVLRGLLRTPERIDTSSLHA